MGQNKYSDEELLAEIRRLSEPGDPVTIREMNEDGLYPHDVYVRRFESWNEALRTAGVNINKAWECDIDRILTAIREHTNKDGRSLSYTEFNDKADIAVSTLKNHCGTWWKAITRAGCYPSNRRPLRPDQYHAFHEAALDQSDPIDTLSGLLTMFTGVPAVLYDDLSPSWFDRVESKYETVVSVPPEYTSGSKSWNFILPETFTVRGDSHETKLPEAVAWCIQSSSKWLDRSDVKVQQTTRRIGSVADIGHPFRSRSYSQGGDRPDIHPQDLRATLGVQMARNGAPTQSIRRHLGIKHTNWAAEVDDFFLWLYVHEGYEHPDYEPPDVVVDPSTGEVR